MSCVQVFGSVPSPLFNPFITGQYVIQSHSHFLMNAALDCCDTREKRSREKGSEREWGKTKFEHQTDIDTVWIKAEERERECETERAIWETERERRQEGGKGSFQHPANP